MRRALLVCVILTSSVRGQDRFASLDEYIGAGLEKWQVPGLAIAVVKDGKIVLARGYGVRHVGRAEPVATDTVFSIASCTKSFTAACIAMLVDEGRLHWDDPVRKHLPDFKVADPYVTRHVTIRDLLCHRTGLVRGDLLGMSGGFTHAEMLHRIQFLPQAKPFRSGVTYHNLMYTVLGEIIQKKTGLSWQDFVARRVFGPLEMNSTRSRREAVAANGLATRHRLYDGEVAPLRTLNADTMFPAGGIYSTVTDMANWLTLHLAEGDRQGRQLIQKTSVREMHALHQSIPVKRRPNASVYDAHFVGTGLGWYVRDYRGRKVIQHGGAWGADMALVPEEGLGVVILSNRDWNSFVWMLSYDIIDAYVLGPDRAWTQGEKWQHWLSFDGPNAARDLAEQRAFFEKNRKRGTRLSLPLAEYAGTYQSVLYSDLKVSVVDERLRVRFGDYLATLGHWDHDTFYGRTVIEPFLDWHVKFDVDGHRSVRGLEIINVGWKDPDERFLFTRRADGAHK